MMRNGMLSTALFLLVGCTNQTPSMEAAESAAETTPDPFPDAPEVLPCPAAVEGMACIEGGPFERGATTAPVCSLEPAAGWPPTLVWLQTFTIDAHEVTQRDYASCVSSGLCEPLVEQGASQQAADQPVTGVSWSQAAQYCEAVGKHLPTETEWEAAARGPEQAIYPWGQEPASCARAVIQSEAGPSCGEVLGEEGGGQPLPVGSRPPAANGTFDLVGNAPEWVADWFVADLEACGASCQGLSPAGPCAGQDACDVADARVVRGGSWARDASCNTAVHRRPAAPGGDPADGIGFRCAASAEEAAGLASLAPLSARGADRLCAARQGSSERPELTYAAESWAAVDSVYREHAGTLLAEVNASYKSAEMVERLLCDYAERFEDIAELHQLGVSHGGRPLLALRVSSAPRVEESRPAVLLNAAHHGHELLSVDYGFDALDEVLREADDPEIATWLSTFDLWFIPMVNPDGVDTILHATRGPKKGRKNGRDTNDDGRYEPALHEGVDLNRNYPFMWGGLGEQGSQSRAGSSYYRGPTAGSEPETQAIVRLAERHRFVAAISWHTHGTMVISPYTIDGVKNPTPDVAWQVAETMIAATGKQPNGRGFVVRRSMYPVDGTDQDWHYHQHGTLAYIVEGSHHNPLDLETREQSTVGARPLYRALLNRLLTGPSVYGFVRDAEGRPVEAVVTIAEVTLSADERWTSRPWDGAFERLLPGEGTYTVTAQGPDGASVSTEVTVGLERKRLDITLK